LKDRDFTLKNLLKKLRFISSRLLVQEFAAFLLSKIWVKIMKKCGGKKGGKKK